MTIISQSYFFYDNRKISVWWEKEIFVWNTEGAKNHKIFSNPFCLLEISAFCLWNEQFLLICYSYMIHCVCITIILFKDSFKKLITFFSSACLSHYVIFTVLLYTNSLCCYLFLLGPHIISWLVQACTYHKDNRQHLSMLWNYYKCLSI